MNDLLESIKADLLDRRLLPLFALVALALLAALGYAAFGGGSSAPAPSPAAPSSSTKPPGIAVSEANTSSAEPVAETTSGASKQSGGRTRNPFASLPSAKAASAAGATGTSVAGSGSSAAGSSPSTSSGGGGGTSSAGASTGPSSGAESGGESKPSSSTGGSTPKKKSAQQPKSQTDYQVSVLFGAAAPGTPPQSASLTPYDNLQRQQPLPSAPQGVVVFRGVVAGGKSATFTIVGEAIPRGSGACQPSASQCQAIDLQAGETEELEFLPAEGPAVNYLLQLVSIKPVKAGSASVRHDLESESKAGLNLLRSLGLTALPGLRYSTAHRGVLVFAGHRASAARAHLAVWGAAPRG
jgi:hypothetical protein